MGFGLYLITAAWQDGRKQEVSGWLFLFFFVHFLASQICRQTAAANMAWYPAQVWYCGMNVEDSKWCLFAGCLIGAALLVISRITKGALGEGDGIFFLISGIYLGFWKNLFLLCSSLFLSSLAGLVYLVWGRFLGKDYRKKTLPFLVFALPAGIWLACGA